MGSKAIALGKKMELKCGGTIEKKHFKDRGKLFGIEPFSHCDTDCPYLEGNCLSHCSGLSIPQRPCLQEDFKNNVRIKTARISNLGEALKITEEIEGLVQRGETLTEKQRHDHEFAKIFLNELKKRRSDPEGK